MSHPILDQLKRAGVMPASATLDSRAVVPGSLFLAVPGDKVDGRQYIADAIARGAIAVLWEADSFTWNPAWTVPNEPVRDLREQLGDITAALYGEPSSQLSLIGVTGTNGKTSSSHWLMQAFSALGRKTAVIGTVGNGFAGDLAEAANTTPDAVSLQRLLADYRDAGARVVAMEVSSHALDQGRVNGARFSTALFTNLTRDHLDYHGTMEAYGAAKAKLFAWPGLQHAVVNDDDPFDATLVATARRFGAQVTTYGLEQGDIRCSSIQLGLAGTTLHLITPQGEAQVTTGLIGAFNVSNLLGVLGVLLAEGVALADAVRALSGIKSVAGRMQRVGNGTDEPLVVVDYAHTPDALEKALSTLKAVLPEGGRLISVFGCGGDRDPGKRPVMGEISGRLADHTIVTSDNPRTEDPQRIVEQVAAGVAGSHEIEIDRRAAITTAVSLARTGDVVLIAGKGHEDYQIIGTTKHHFDDVEEAQAALASWREAHHG